MCRTPPRLADPPDTAGQGHRLQQESFFGIFHVCCAGHGLNYASRELGVPFIRRMSPALWAYGAEKAYKVLRVAAPELP